MFTMICILPIQRTMKETFSTQVISKIVTLRGRWIHEQIKEWPFQDSYTTKQGQSLSFCIPKNGC